MKGKRGKVIDKNGRNWKETEKLSLGHDGSMMEGNNRRVGSEEIHLRQPEKT